MNIPSDSIVEPPAPAGNCSTGSSSRRLPQSPERMMGLSRASGQLGRETAICSGYASQGDTPIIVNSAYSVHKTLGPVLLERVYEVCFCHELSKRELEYQRQVDILIVYDGIVFDEGLRLDVLMEWKSLLLVN